MVDYGDPFKGTFASTGPLEVDMGGSHSLERQSQSEKPIIQVQRDYNHIRGYRVLLVDDDPYLLLRAYTIAPDFGVSFRGRGYKVDINAKLKGAAARSAVAKDLGIPDELINGVSTGYLRDEFGVLDLAKEINSFRPKVVGFDINLGEGSRLSGIDYCNRFGHALRSEDQKHRDETGVGLKNTEVPITIIYTSKASLLQQAVNDPDSVQALATFPFPTRLFLKSKPGEGEDVALTFLDTIVDIVEGRMKSYSELRRRP